MHALVDDLIPVGLDLALGDILKIFVSKWREMKTSLYPMSRRRDRGRTP